MNVRTCCWRSVSGSMFVRTLYENLCACPESVSPRNEASRPEPNDALLTRGVPRRHIWKTESLYIDDIQS
jgi:hypothetical protein